MVTFNESMNEYRNQLKKGSIKEAYRGLMEYFNALRLYFKKKYPGHSVSSSVYYGYMDMTYFSFVPDFFKHRQLKIAIVFLHEEFRFEVWLCGYNKRVQTKYWKLVKDSNWKKYRIPSRTKGVDSIIEYTLVGHPNFNELEKLTEQIESGVLTFVSDVEAFLSKR